MQATPSSPTLRNLPFITTYESVSESFRTGRLEGELQVAQLSATSCSFIAILWVSLVSFAATTLCVASQYVFIVVVVYFVIDPVRKLLDTPLYVIFTRHACESHAEVEIKLITVLKRARLWSLTELVESSTHLHIILSSILILSFIYA
jgi:hypothetical protein